MRQTNQSLGRSLGSGDIGKSMRQLLVIMESKSSKIHKLISNFILKGKQVLRIKRMDVNVERLASVVWKASKLEKNQRTFPSAKPNKHVGSS